MSTIRVVNVQHTDATEPNIVLQSDGTSVFASGITISGGTNLTVSGTAEFASGTVSAPGITFIDDNNTGIYEPAANTVAITTAATERLRVDSTGNVGIGLDTNLAGLCVNNTIRSQNTSNNISYIGFTGYTGNTTVGTMYSYMGGDGRSTGYLSFSTNDTERMRIDSSGQLLVGTTSVTTAGAAGNISLETSDPRINIVRKSNNTGGAALGFAKTRSTGSPGTIVQSGDKLGTLVFYGDDGTDLNTIASRIDCEVDGTPGSNDMPGRLVFSTTADGASSPTERMRIDSSGRLLVGTTSARTNYFNSNIPAILQTEGTLIDNSAISIVLNEANDTSGSGLILARTRGSTVGSVALVGNNAPLGAIYFQGADGTDFVEGARIQAFVDGTPGANDMPTRLVFSTNNGAASTTERMRIDSSGRVGIGTSSPGTILDARGIVSFGSSALNNAVIQRSFVPTGSYNLTLTGGGGLTSEGATTPTDALGGAVIKLVGGSPTTDTYGGGIAYYANGHTSPNAAGQGNAHAFFTRSGVNTYTERMRILSGGGITFNGDTAAANALDDYEEGTWTPSVSSGGWSGISNIAAATYTKVGSKVTVWAYLDSFTGTGSTANFTLSGLPFNASTNNYAPGPADFGNGGKVGAYARVDQGNNNVIFLVSSGSAGVTRPTIKGNEFNSNSYLIFSLTYTAA